MTSRNKSSLPVDSVLYRSIRTIISFASFNQALWALPFPKNSVVSLPAEQPRIPTVHVELTVTNACVISLRTEILPGNLCTNLLCTRVDLRYTQLQGFNSVLARHPEIPTTEPYPIPCRSEPKILNSYLALDPLVQSSLVEHKYGVVLTGQVVFLSFHGGKRPEPRDLPSPFSIWVPRST
jgi:hypothetical protein